jgi:hypothetical protein
MAADIQILLDSETQFGHYTNGCMNLYRYYSHNDDPYIFGIYEPLPEMVVLSQFFNLYDQNWENSNNIHYHTEVDGIRKIEVNGSLIKISGDDQPGILTLGYCMKLLQAPLQYAITDEMRLCMKQQIANGLEKYFGSQLIYCFLLGTGFFGTKGVRIYFDQKSLDLLKHIYVPPGNELSFTLNYRHILSHFIKEENMKIYTYWNTLCTRLEKEFDNTPGIRIEIPNDVNTTPEYNSLAEPVNSNIRNIKIIVNGDNPDHILTGFIKLYQYFICFNNKLDERNKYLEFYAYEFTHPAYIQKYRVLLQSVLDVADHVECMFQYHIGQGFIGQAVRYVALSQTSYVLKLPGAADTRVESPQMIHIRDAHHACPTVFETALMSAFHTSDKRCFFTTGPYYQTPWHDVYTSHGDRIVPDYDSVDYDALGNPRGDSTRSIWAGIQSFKKLPGDMCVFGSVSTFRQTLGVMFHHHQLTYEQQCELYGIKYSETYKEDGKPDKPGEFYLFSYGIDERLFVNCFYPQIWVEFRDDGIIETIRPLTSDELAFAAWGRRKTPAEPFPEKPDDMPNTMYDVFDTVYNKKFVYIIDLDYRAWTLKVLSKNSFSMASISAVARGAAIHLFHEYKSYLEYHKSCPKTPYDLIKHVEHLRQYEYPLVEHVFASIYHNGNTLFRSYNQQILARTTQVYYNNIFKFPSIKNIKDVFTYINTIPIKVRNRIRSTHKNIYINDVYSFIKNSSTGVSYPCTGSVLDGREGRSPGHPKYGKCMTQPYDYPGVEAGPPGYKFRGVAINPPLDTAFWPLPYSQGKMSGGRRTRRRRKQHGGGGVMEQIKQFLDVLAFKDAVSADTIQKTKPIAYDILKQCIRDESMFDVLKKTASEIYPYVLPDEASMHLYYDPPLNSYCQMHISDFLSKFQTYMKEYDNSYGAVAYYDIYFNLPGKPNLVHYSSVFASPIAHIKTAPIFKKITQTPTPRRVQKTRNKTSVKLQTKTRKYNVQNRLLENSQQLVEV